VIAVKLLALLVAAASPLCPPPTITTSQGPVIALI
jgi:hypothetical protein